MCSVGGSESDVVVVIFDAALAASAEEENDKEEGNCFAGAAGLDGIGARSVAPGACVGAGTGTGADSSRLFIGTADSSTCIAVAAEFPLLATLAVTSEECLEALSHVVVDFSVRF